ncbi:ComF family protein [Paeniglutamicibacter cryotolerans]|uniref:Putative amidophosphoribosyltransferase n=1 Tax=Paeniglutamicibacter cryotolerans TaxID=670079 RepID=A0A839QRK1_9MICC|nr:ComF family protein [Paeniglutamicibacter cryotolerans]MBB2996606.1 putative amidophosphoribosyltransferase [Paeniglutamicibacter cryotolerans]
MNPLCRIAGPAAWLDGLWAGPGMTAVRRSVSGAWALVLPADCACCQRPDTGLCPPCRAALRAATVRPLRVEQDAEALPLTEGGAPLPVLAAGRYELGLAAALLAFKNRQRVGLRHTLGPALAGAIQAAAAQLPDASDRRILLVPVPSRLRARLRRGYWPVGMLLAWVEARRLLPAGMATAPLLVHRSGGQKVHEQKGQGRRGRASIRGSLRVLRGSRPDPRIRVLLVDDVLTTGATLAECHRVLSARGWVVCGAVVVAATAAPREGAAEIKPSAIDLSTQHA